MFGLTTSKTVECMSEVILKLKEDVIWLQKLRARDANESKMIVAGANMRIRVLEAQLNSLRVKELKSDLLQKQYSQLKEDYDRVVKVAEHYGIVVVEKPCQH